MKKRILIIMVILFSVNNAWAIDGSIYADKVQTTYRTESWGNKIGPFEMGWYVKLNLPREGKSNVFGEAQMDYLPIEILGMKLGVEANFQYFSPSETEYLGRGYLAAAVGPFLFRYSAAQTDGNHKLSVCWYQPVGRFSLFGYYDREYNCGQKALNIMEGYIGYEIYKDTIVFTGIKPVWIDGDTPKINPGVGLKVSF